MGNTFGLISLGADWTCAIIFLVFRQNAVPAMGGSEISANWGSVLRDFLELLELWFEGASQNDQLAASVRMFRWKIQANTEIIVENTRQNSLKQELHAKNITFVCATKISRTEQNRKGVMGVNTNGLVNGPCLVPSKFKSANFIKWNRQVTKHDGFISSGGEQFYHPPLGIFQVFLVSCAFLQRF